MLFFHILSSPPYLLLPFQLVLWQEEVAEAIEERAVGEIFSCAEIWGQGKPLLPSCQSCQLLTVFLLF